MGRREALGGEMKVFWGRREALVGEKEAKGGGREGNFWERLGFSWIKGGFREGREALVGKEGGFKLRG